MIPFVDLGAQYRSIKSEIDSAIQDVLLHSNFILGSHVEEFEQAFALFVGTKYAVGVSNGLDALRLALKVLDIGPGDEVIIPANSYIATALAVSDVGARPVFVDCDPHTYNIDVTRIEPAITSQTRAIIPVHLTGQAADMDSILEIASHSHHKLQVIEDAAQAHGTLYKGRPCGSMGIMGCFSFYPGKNLGAYGDGGIVVTNDSRLAERLRLLRHYGQPTKYVHVEKGYNARLDTLQAAVLKVKLRYLQQWNQARENHARKYLECLTGIGDLIFQQCLPYSTHIYHLFVTETDHRDALRDHLGKHGVQTNMHYPIPIHLQGAYKELGYTIGDFPCAEHLAKVSMSLPMFPELTAGQIQYVIDRIREFYSVESMAKRCAGAH